MADGSDEAAQTGAGAGGLRVLAPELDPPFDVIEPRSLDTCLVLSSPHSGNVYPACFLASARLDAISLRRSEDAFVDLLVQDAVRWGLPLLRARFPRAFLDVNREPFELDPRMFDGRLPPFVNSRSIRVAGGLGTIARVVGEAQEIYARRLTVEEGIARIDGLYRPYHAALKALLARATSRFGCALLIDCHSMPSYHGTAQGAGVGRDDRLKADFVIGDRYGTSCDPLIAAELDDALSRRGYRVERNKPYAGGFITENYGRPSEGCHALQIEVNRALYMDERLIRPNAAFSTIAADIAGALGSLAHLMRGPPLRNVLAAE